MKRSGTPGAGAHGSLGSVVDPSSSSSSGNGRATASGRSASTGAVASRAGRDACRSTLGAFRGVAVPSAAAGGFSRFGRSFLGRARAAPPACDSDSDAGTSIRSARSLQSASTEAPRSLGAVSEEGVQHEGWLSKKTSGKVSARWQRRYFSLRGPVLRYAHSDTAAAKRSFDVRRARSAGLATGQPRELELDFGFRVWRLRANTPEEARRWALLLEAARLVAGGDDDELGEDWSDEESARSSTASTSASSADTGESTPRFGHQARGVEDLELLPSPPIADLLEVDPEGLDGQFREWFPVESWGRRIAGAPHSRNARAGLELAITGLWIALGRPAGDAECCGPEEVAAALANRPGSADPPEAVRAVVEHVLSEYLARMRAKLERWIVECNPVADEVADTIDWWLLEAWQAFEVVTKGVEALAETEPSWRSAVDSIVCFLLSEWESRSCDEVSAKCRVAAPHCVAAAAADTSLAASVCAEPPATAATEEPQAMWSVVERDEELGRLRAVTCQWEAWRHHQTACDRAASVLIASLSAALRSFRSRERALMGSTGVAGTGPQAACEGLRARTRERFLRLLRELRQRALKKGGLGAPVPAASVVAAAAAEAAAFTEFCSLAQVPGGNQAAASICAEVLEAFAAAFRHESAELCLVLAEVNFVTSYRTTLRSISFDARQVTEAVSVGQGPLNAACTAASAFLREHCSAAPALCRSLACDALAQVLAHRWARQFRRAAPRLSVCPSMPRAVAADEDLLLALAEEWGAISGWASGVSSPVQPLTEVREILEQEPASPESAAACAGRLEVLLGARSGQSLAETARWAAAH